MPQVIKIRSIEPILKIIESRPELKDLSDKEVILYRGIIPDGEGVEKAIDVENRQITAVVSTPEMDSHGDTINPKGFDWGRYDKNPVLLHQHKSHEDSIGTCIRHWLDEKNFTMATFEFAEGGQAEETFQKYVKKHQRAFSIGFRVKKWGTAITENDPNGYVFDEIEIYEISAVTLPANEDALTANSFKSLYKSLDADEAKELELPEDAIGLLKHIAQGLDKLNKALDNKQSDKSQSGTKAEAGTTEKQAEDSSKSTQQSLRIIAKTAGLALRDLKGDTKISIKTDKAE